MFVQNLTKHLSSDTFFLAGSCLVWSGEYFNNQKLLSVENILLFSNIINMGGVKGREVDSIPAITIGYKGWQRGEKNINYAQHQNFHVFFVRLKNKLDLIRQCSYRGSIVKEKSVGVKKRPVGVVQKQMCAALTAHKVWKVRSLLRRRTLAHVGLHRVQTARLEPLTVSLVIHNFRASSHVCGL